MSSLIAARRRRSRRAERGNTKRGTGILNNDLYVGRRVWNRQRFVKDPNSGKRQARLNGSSDWTMTNVPHLRIIDDELWNAVKARQEKVRHVVRDNPVHARQPRYLFSGLTKCAVCGGGFILSSHDLLTASTPASAALAQIAGASNDRTSRRARSERSKSGSSSSARSLSSAVASPTSRNASDASASKVKRARGANSRGSIANSKNSCRRSSTVCLARR